MKKLTDKELRQWSGRWDEDDVLDFDPPSCLRSTAAELLRRRREVRGLRKALREISDAGGNDGIRGIAQQALSVARDNGFKDGYHAGRAQT